MSSRISPDQTVGKTLYFYRMVPGILLFVSLVALSLMAPSMWVSIAFAAVAFVTLGWSHAVALKPRS